MCPFLQSDCIQTKCKFWAETDKECMIVRIFNLIYLLKEDYLLEIRQKVNKLYEELLPYSKRMD